MLNTLKTSVHSNMFIKIQYYTSIHTMKYAHIVIYVRIMPFYGFSHYYVIFQFDSPLIRHSEMVLFAYIS